MCNKYNKLTEQSSRDMIKRLDWSQEVAAFFCHWRKYIASCTKRIFSRHVIHKTQVRSIFIIDEAVWSADDFYQLSWSTALSSAGLTTVTICSLVHSVLWIGSSGWWMQQRDLSAILVGWHLYLVCCTIDFNGCACLSESGTSSVSRSSKLTMVLQLIISLSSADQTLNTSSFSTPLGSTRRSAGSTFEDQLWWLCVCSRRASIMEQTTSNNLIIWQWHSSEVQEPIESSLLLIALFFFSINLEHGRPYIGLHVTVPKKLTLYYYYYCYYYYYYMPKSRWYDMVIIIAVMFEFRELYWWKV